MASFINTNVASLNAQNNLASSQGGLSQSLERLSSGLRINTAADDAAGLAISSRMSSQINGLTQAARNANDGISLAQTAGGALSSVAANLQTLRQLAVESANATNTSSDRQALNAEAQQLVNEIQNTANTTQFNGLNLLDGSFVAQQFQVGANANQTIAVSVQGATTNTLGNFGGASATTVGTAGAASAWTVANSIIINGTTIGASNATSAPGVSASSAAAKAAAINAQTTLTGVTATGFTTTDSAQGAVTGSATPVVAATANSATASGQLWINGVAVGSISAATTELGQIQNAANAINAVASQSGVTAIADATTGKLTLNAADGRDIQIATDTAADATTVLNATGLAADVFTPGSGTGIAANGNLLSTDTYTTQGGLFTGALTLNSSAAVNITATAAATNAVASAGLTGYSATLASLSTLDITSVTGSNAAINIVDAAINQINGQQANLGAIQNRFTSTISNLNTSSTNLSSARSRIEDTDYAAETANLAHYQILQQAGTAMLAQANSLPNSILTLLR
ncbi:MAG: flagellin [Burkholderiaceae bacterium]|nr:flagellin [Burkholderiaceae bacterium]